MQNVCGGISSKNITPFRFRNYHPFVSKTCSEATRAHQMKRKGPPRGDKFDPLGLLLMELRVKIEMGCSRCFCTSSATLLSSCRGNCNALNRRCHIRKSRLIGCHCELYRLTSHFQYIRFFVYTQCFVGVESRDCSFWLWRLPAWR